MALRSTRVLALVAAAVALVAACAFPATARAADAEPALSEAQSAIVTDSAGNVLYSKDPEAELPMASITKVMTAMVALDSGESLDTVCELQDVELGEASQSAGYRAGETATLGELLRVMLVYSANDAAEEIALNVAGSEQAFVDLMNAKAAELGMSHTHFANAHGLEEDGHYSCAEDLAAMGRYALAHYPFIAETVRTRSVTVTIGGVQETLDSTDHLMGTYRGLVGIKTGAVASGTTFLGASERDGVRLYTAVLGCQTDDGRFTDTAALMDWAYGTYDAYVLTRRAWVVRYVSYAFHFGLKCLVTASADTTGYLWPDGGATTYSKVLTRPGILVAPGDPYGAELWVQDGRVVAAASYEVRGVLVRVPSFGAFTSSLFYDQTVLGPAL